MNRTPNLRKRRGERLDEWQAALKRIKEDGQRRSSEETRGAIVAYFEQVKDEGITAERISLLCPISNKRVAVPARGVDCTHFACFDLATFVELQSKTPYWDCPFVTCMKKLSCSTVVIDEYIADVLSEVDDVVAKIELLPSGAWTPVEVEHDTTESVDDTDNGDDIQVVLDKSITRNQEEIAKWTVPVSVLEELHRQIGGLLEQFNALGYKRLGGIAASLADMNIFVKQQIREAREPATSTRNAGNVPSTSAEPVATQPHTASATQDASSQTSPLEPNCPTVASIPSSTPNVASGPSQRASTQPFDGATANADLQPIRHATPRDSTVHTTNRRAPIRGAPPKPKPASAKRVSASSQPISHVEDIDGAIYQLPLDARAWLADAVTHPDLSFAGKLALLKESFILAAADKLDADACRLLLRLQLAQNRKIPSGMNMAASVSPSPASSQPALAADPVTVNAHEADTNGGKSPVAVKRRSRFDLAAAGSSLEGPPGPPVALNQAVTPTSQSDANVIEMVDLTQATSSASRSTASTGTDVPVSSNHMASVIASVDVPLPPNWAAARAPNGPVYYLYKITKETRWEPPTEAVADTTSDDPDLVLARTVQEKELKEKIYSIIKKRFEPHRMKYKPDPVDYEQFIRKLLSKVLEKELSRGTDLKVTDIVVLSTRRYVDSWVKILDKKRASSRADDATPAGPEGPSPTVVQSASSISKSAPH